MKGIPVFVPVMQVVYTVNKDKTIEERLSHQFKGTKYIYYDIGTCTWGSHYMYIEEQLQS